MRCVVPACGNNSSDTTSQEINYFIFPTDPSWRAAWLMKLDKQGLKLEEKSSVCSKHFLKGDLLISSGGACVLRTGAVPVVDLLNNSSCEYSTVPCDVKICRVCLATNTELYQMNVNMILYKAYETLTGLLMDNEINLPQNVCTACSQQLLNYSRLRSQSLQAHMTLSKIVKTHGSITLESVHSLIEGHSVNLTHSGIDQCDLDIKLPEKENTHNDAEKDMINMIGLCEDISINGIKMEKLEFNHNILNENSSNVVIGHVSSLQNGLGVEIIKSEGDYMINSDIYNEGTTDCDNVHIFTKHDDVTDDIIKAEYDDVMYNNSVVAEFRYDRDEYGDTSAGGDHASVDRLLSGQLIQVPERSAAGVKLEVKLPEGDASQRVEDDCAPLTAEKLSCDLCSFETIHVYEFLSHLKAHAFKKSYDCDMCSYKTSKHSSLVRHRTVHLDENACSCNVCGCSCYKKSHLRRHLRTHSGEKRYSCDVCQKKFSLKCNLVSHLRIHSGEKPYSCNVCKKPFARTDHLKTHLLLHSDEKRYSCDVCNKAFNTKGILKQHLELHFGNKSFSCDLCNSVFIRKYNLIIHMRSHSAERPHACYVCKQRYKYSRDLRNHLRRYSSELTYSCQVCSEVFHTEAQLQKHSPLHSVDNLYSCPICDRTFIYKSYLQKHALIHSNEKAYSCHVCKKSFKTMSHLKRHLNIHSIS